MLYGVGGGGNVGMGGISFSGITQLFPAGTNPPHLAAVSPLSVTDDVYYGTGSDVLYMRTTEGPKRVDVLYRRVDDDYIDPLQFRPDFYNRDVEI